ncbi:MAG TPA: NADH-quinone oxidoreductase subunit M [Gaiellaceae bacterium]|nr:NADH-quinone oxidoreductase subunit M [Gaiellaceae bacterium]
MTGTDWQTTTLVVLPFAGALAIWFLPLARYTAGATAVLISLAEVAVWIDTVQRFDFSSPALQFAVRRSWFRDLGVSYHVGFFGFSLWLVGLTVVVMAACVVYGFWAQREHARAYFGLMLFLTGAIVGVMTAQDLLVFYAFFDAMLIPLYVLVGVWGGPRRGIATIKLVVYTLTGSLLMLAAVIWFGLHAGTFDLIDSGTSSSIWLFLGFMAAFAVKLPFFPLHGWLPDAYREAPPEVTAALSGVVSKAAIYGMLRIAISKFPGPTHDVRPAILALAAVGLVYGSLYAFRAPDFRGVVAYSSLAHLGLIVLGLFAGNDLGYDGAILQSVNHGLVTAGLFLLAGSIERRTGTGLFSQLGGMARGRPALATAVMTAGILSLAVPLSANFAGEFLILAGVFRQGWGWAVVGGFGVVLAAMYMLRAISGVLHQDVGPAVREEALDLRPAELAFVAPLLACVVALSVWPNGISGRAFARGTGARQTVATELAGMRTGWTGYAPLEAAKK